MIYLAPLQGFTDYTYRKVFSEYFGGVDAYFIPYISVKNAALLPKHIKEIIPENNPQKNVIPQVLFSNDNELQLLLTVIQSNGYKSVNLNLGCPYPMVTNRGKGSALLTDPEKLKNILHNSLKNKLEISVKLRSGLTNETDILKIITVLNEFNLKEIIYHPRVASQLYRGEINSDLFQLVSEKSIHPVVYNGDILTLEDFVSRNQTFKNTSSWMIGRGILQNPYLPNEISGIYTSPDEKLIQLKNFHDELFENYSNQLSGGGHVLNRMRQFWIYFSYSFQNQHKTFKKIKKAKSIESYNAAIAEIFQISNIL